MNIKTTGSVSQALAAYQSKTPVKTGPEKPAGSPASMSVALSAGSQSLFDVDQDVDVAKVQALREALANGTFKINPERIAEGLINSAAELMNR